MNRSNNTRLSFPAGYSFYNEFFEFAQLKVFTLKDAIFEAMQNGAFDSYEFVTKCESEIKEIKDNAIAGIELDLREDRADYTFKSTVRSIARAWFSEQAYIDYRYARDGKFKGKFFGD